MSDPKLLVSILIDNYNYGRFLRDAIDSALNQTYGNTEVIVVDDGSTDDSREIIASYGNRIIPVLKENGGQASAFNAGLASCKGGFVCYLDADDIWLPQKVERVCETAVAHPDAIFIYHRVQPVSSELRQLQKMIPSRLMQGDIASKVKDSCGWWASAPTSGLCVPRDVLQRIGPIPEEEFRVCADAFLCYLLPLLGRVVGLPEGLALYRLHGANNYNSGAASRRRREREVLLSRAASYESYVGLVNERLEQMGAGVVLDLDRHWNYQFAKYLARSPERFSVGRFVWRTLCYPGEPSTLNRLRMAAAIIRNCFWKRDIAPTECESTLRSRSAGRPAGDGQ